MTIIRLLPFFLLFAFTPKGLLAQFAEPDFNEQIVASGLDLPNGITFDKNGRGYIWHMKGKILLMDTLGNIQSEPFLDLSEEVAKWLDNGLLGFTLHPDFPETPYVYALYVVDMHHYNYSGTAEYNPESSVTKSATFGRIARYTADSEDEYSKVDPNSKKILLGQSPDMGFPILFDSHGVGSLVFGTDGTLLASSGDASSSIDLDTGNNPSSYFLKGLENQIITENENVGAFKSQMVNSLAGKIIRIDAETGSGIPGNPFYEESNPASHKSKIWALGLRNGFRFAMEPESGSHFSEDADPGRIILGDVGYESWEEVNVIDDRGRNLGWPIYEGFEKGAYSQIPVFNKNAINDFVNASDCPDHFYFQDLILPDHKDNFEGINNPCKTQQKIPEHIPTFKHHRPALSYRNQADGFMALTLVPDFDANGNPVNKLINDYLPETSHFEGIASIGGTFYNGNIFPEKFQNKYFHIDFVGWIKAMGFDEDGKIIEIMPFYQGIEKLVSIAMNPKNGYLYAISTEGTIHEISYKGNQRPQINVEHSPLYGLSPLKVQFDATESFDDQDSMSFHWDFGNGVVDHKPKTEYSFISDVGMIKNYEVSLVIKDSFGLEASQKYVVSVNNTPPKIEIVEPQNGSFYPNDASHIHILKGLAADEESDHQSLKYKWKTFLHHEDHFHDDISFNSKEAYLISQPTPCNSDTYWYRIQLGVEDEYGLTSSQEIEIFPNCEQDAYPEIVINSETLIDGIDITLKSMDIEFGDKVEFQRQKHEYEFEVLSNNLLGNIETLAEIHFFDDNPIMGPNIYRAKLLKENGDWFFSNISIADFPNLNTLKIIPNPSASAINLEFEKPKYPKLELEIYNFQGLKVYNSVVRAEVDRKFNLQLSLPDLANGTYLIVLKNGDLVFNKRLIIMK